MGQLPVGQTQNTPKVMPWDACPASLSAGGCASCRSGALHSPKPPGSLFTCSRRQLRVAALGCHNPWPAYSSVKWSLFRTLFDERRSNGPGTPGLNQTWARMAFSQIVRLLGFQQTLCSAQSSAAGRVIRAEASCLVANPFTLQCLLWVCCVSSWANKYRALLT